MSSLLKPCKEVLVKSVLGNFPGGLAVKTLCFHCRGHRFYPWLGNGCFIVTLVYSQNIPKKKFSELDGRDIEGGSPPSRGLPVFPPPSSLPAQSSRGEERSSGWTVLDGSTSTRRVFILGQTVATSKSLPTAQHWA